MNERSPSLRRAVSGRAESDYSGSVRRPWEGRADEIVEVAALLFRDNGYAGTSMSDIAAAVGILPGSLYHYISSKEELLYSVMHRAHHQVADEVERQPLASLPADEALRLIVQVHVDQNVQHQHFNIVANINLQDLNAAHRAEILELRSAYRRLISDVIRRGQHEGAWCQLLDPVLASLAVSSVVNSSTNWYRPGETRWTVDTMGSQFSSMVAMSLACDHEPACHGA